VHLLSGYSYLKWGDFRANPEHPPLAKVLAALPLLAFDVRDPRPSTPDWDRIPDSKPGPATRNVARKMFFVDNDADRLFFYAKLPMIGLGMILGVFVFLWAKDLYGLTVAAAALFIYCLDPNILAHSQAVHTDIPFATFFFISCYFFWRALNDLSRTNLLLASLFFGLAAITKYSFLTILPVWGVLGVFSIYFLKAQRCSLTRPRLVSGQWERAVLLVGTIACGLITAYIFIWVAYGFRFHAIPGGNRLLSLAPVMSDQPFVNAAVSFLIQHHLFPEAWVYGQLYILKDLRRLTYLLGQTSIDGFWLYFPVALTVKTPVSTLVLLAVALGGWIFNRKARFASLFLLIPALLYFSLAVWSRMNIGLRHILPIYPFLFVLIGGTAAELWTSKTKVKRGCLIFLALWYVWSSLSIYPHYLAYFNELAGGPQNGHRVLIDSNLDWGQDLKGLKRWMDHHERQNIQFLYFGTADPEYYGIKAFYLPGSLIIHPSSNDGNFEPPDYLAVSANLLYGSGIFLTERQKNFLDSYKLRQPVGNIGYSILVYKLDLSDANIHYNVGLISAERGELSKAVLLFRQALRIQPEFADAHIHLAQTLALQGNKDEAVQHYNEALRILKSGPTTTRGH
jgi:tetratricopeptide (TPR) repeat protein